MITPSFSLTATERVLPKLALDFTTASLDPRITFSRTTSATNPATYVNSSGYVTSATNDQPRFDYDPVTLACNGLLIEESKTNSILYSENFENAFWSTEQASISINATTAPDNNITADKLVEDSSNNKHDVVNTNSLGLATGNYVFSIYAKAAGRSVMQIAFWTGSVSGNPRANYDLANGVLGSVDSGITATISPAGNGWYRCTARITFASTSNGVVVQTQTSTTAARFATYQGDGTSGIYIWGAQIESGVFHTSYIPTTSTALTRNADSAAMTGSNFTSWFDSTAGTIVFQAAQQVIFPQSKTVGSLTGGGEGFNIYRQSAGTINGYVRPGGLVLNPGATAVAGVPWKAAFAYSGGNCSYCAKSSSIVTGSYTTVTANLTTLTIGALYAGATEIFNGTVNRVWFYPQKFTDAQLQAITHD